MIALHPVFRRLNDWLAGWPDTALTVALLLAAALIVLIALRGSPLMKAVTVAYVYLP